MKFTIFATAFLVTITAHAYTTVPMTFFTKINNTFVAFGTEKHSRLTNLKLLAFGESKPSPTEFILEDGKYARVKNSPHPAYFGHYQDKLSFGSGLNILAMNLSSEGQLQNEIYFVEHKLLDNGAIDIGPIHWVSRGTQLFGESKQIDIYFLPFEKRKHSNGEESIVALPFESITKDSMRLGNANLKVEITDPHKDKWVWKVENTKRNVSKKLKKGRSGSNDDVWLWP